MSRHASTTPMFVVITMLSYLLCALGVPDGGPELAGATTRVIKQDAAPVIPDCSPNQEDQDAPTTAAPSFLPPTGSGLTVEVLAAAPLVDVPLGRLRLVLRRVELPSGEGADPRTSQGQLLYYVQSGTVTFYVGGTKYVRSERSCLSVPAQTEISYINDGQPAAPAVLERLSLAPGGAEDTEITTFVEPSDSGTGPGSTLLMRADVAPFSSASDWLFLARSTWAEAGGDAGWQRHPGPVGVHVEAGGLSIDLPVGHRDLPTGGCAYFPAGVAHRESAASGPASILIFGVIATGALLWTPAQQPGPGTVEPTPEPSEVSCRE
jgi:quercetin dioxygenase-like cupin family protein